MVCCFPTHYSFCPFRPMYTPCLFPLLCCVLFCVVFCVVVCCALSYVCQLHEMEMYDHYLVCLSYGCVVLCCVVCCVVYCAVCCVGGVLVARWLVVVGVTAVVVVMDAAQLVLQFINAVVLCCVVVCCGVLCFVLCCVLCCGVLCFVLCVPTARNGNVRPLPCVSVVWLCCVVLCCVLCCVLCSVLCWGCVSGAVVSRGRSDGSSSRHGRCAIGSPTHKRSGVVLCCRMIACCVRGDRRVVLW